LEPDPDVVPQLFCREIILDKLLQPPDGDSRSRLFRLKEYPPHASAPAIIKYIERYRLVEGIVANRITLGGIDPRMVDYLAQLAKRYDAQALKRFAHRSAMRLSPVFWPRHERRCWTKLWRCTTNTSSICAAGRITPLRNSIDSFAARPRKAWRWSSLQSISYWTQYRVRSLQRGLSQKHLRDVLQHIDRDPLDAVSHTHETEVSSMSN